VPAGDTTGWTGGFTHRPSLLGWIMLLSPGIVVGGAIAYAFGWRTWIGAIVGAVFMHRIALYLDWRKGDRAVMSWTIDVANVAELDQITTKLRGMGIPADGHEHTDEDGTVHFVLVAKQKHQSDVEKAIGWA